MKEKLKHILGISIFGIIIFVAIFAFYSFVGSSIFALLSVKFTSIKYLLLFMLLYCILATILELFTDAFIAILIEFRNLNKNQSFLLKFLISVSTKTIIFLICDMISKNVTLTFLSALIAAILIFLIEYKTEESFDNINTNANDLNEIIDRFEDELDKFEDEQKKFSDNGDKEK
ncbi:MAG: YrvL family regulatory protein [Sarcina sp.]